MVSRWVFTYMNSTSGVNDACIAGNAGSEWKCIFAEHTSPFITTPIFPLQGEYDSYASAPRLRHASPAAPALSVLWRRDHDVVRD